PANTKIKEFKKRWTVALDLLEYLNQEYFYLEKEKRWMVAHCQDVSYGCTNTNNLIESWHKVLKMKFLRDHTHRHQDRVIYCLVHHVEPYMKCKVRNENVEAGEKSSERLNELHQVKLDEGFMHKWLSSGRVDSPVEQINKMTL
ncbi:hypothetical protein CPB97_005689, partial [Podila verticillata]